MISELTFANGYTSFWRAATPNLDRLIRNINVAMAQRICPPVQSTVMPERRAFVNELAFEMFRQFSPTSSAQTQAADWQRAAYDIVRARLQRFERSGQSVLADPSADELEESKLLRDNLYRFTVLKARGGQIAVSPRLRGFGFVNDMEADLIVGQQLIEVKAGDRGFRSPDIRQLLVYCAANHLSKQYDLIEVGLFNPRVGKYFGASLDPMAIEISGKSIYELLNEIAYFCTSGDISR